MIAKPDNDGTGIIICSYIISRKPGPVYYAIRYKKI